MDLIKIDAKEYGLEETKAQQIVELFAPMLNEMVALESEYNSIVKLEMSPDTIAKAKELRLKYVKVRTGTAKIHKEVKSFYLKGGKFVDGWKNAQLMASEGIENKLMDIENHFVNIEKEKKIKQLSERTDLLIKYGCTNIPDSLIYMEEEVFQNYLFGVKKSFEMEKEAEQKAADDRIKKQKEDEEERKRVQVENEKLKKEAEEREKKEAAEREEREKIEAERLKKEAAEKKKREIKEEAERIAREKIEKIHLEKEAEERREREKKENAIKEKIRIEREERELELKKEREEKESAERELKRIEAERKEEKEKEERELKRIEDEKKAEEEAELKKGDTDKVKDLINDLDFLKAKYNFSSNSNRKMYKDVCLLLDKIIVHIKKRM